MSGFQIKIGTEGAEAASPLPLGTGLLRWAQMGTNTPSTPPYYQSPGVLSVCNPTARIGVWQTAGWNHMRFGFDMSQFCVETNAATRAGYLAELKTTILAFTAQSIKVVINCAPAFGSYLGYNYVNCAVIGSVAFNTYKARIVEIAEWLQTNTASLPPNLVLFSSYNELPNGANGAAIHDILYPAFRSACSQHWYIASPTNFGDVFGILEFPVWNYGEKSLLDLHMYFPQAASRAGEPNTIWQYVTGIAYPPDPDEYETVKTATFAAIDGSPLSAPEKASQKSLLDGDGLESLKCYYGLGSVPIPLYNTQQDAVWLKDQMFKYVNDHLPTGLAASHIYIGECGVPANVGTNLSLPSRAALLTDLMTAIRFYGFAPCVFGDDYAANYSGWGVPGGLYSQTTPYAAVDATAIAALGL